LGLGSWVCAANSGVPVQRLTPGSSQIVNFDDIREWIHAGRRGEEGGKIVTEGDKAIIAGRGLDSVALRVRSAYDLRKALGSFGRLRSAIQRYFLGAADKDTDPLLDAVATATAFKVSAFQHFSVSGFPFPPIVQRDLEKWVGERCGEC